MNASKFSSRLWTWRLGSARLGKEKDRAWALAAVAEHLTGEQRQQVLGQALDAVAGIGDEKGADIFQNRLGRAVQFLRGGRIIHRQHGAVPDDELLEVSA